MKRRLTGLAVGAFWLALWQLASILVGQEILMVSPVSTFLTLLRLMESPGFYLSVGNTFGRIMLGFDNLGSVLPMIQSGKLRALAVSTKTRSATRQAGMKLQGAISTPPMSPMAG